MKISDQFTMRYFGNVHGVYKPGNVQLTPIILKNSQEYIEKNSILENNQLILYSMEDRDLHQKK